MENGEEGIKIDGDPLVKCCYCALQGPLNVINEHIDNHHHNSTSTDSLSLSTSSRTRVMAAPEIWSDNETYFLMKKYEQYIYQVGPTKHFRRKRDLWEQISADLGESLDVVKTATQCENRYKTIQKRKRKTFSTIDLSTAQVIEDDVDGLTESEGVIVESAEPIEDQIIIEDIEEPAKKKKKVDEIINVLIQLHEKKEEARERRHKEKLVVLQQLCEYYFSHRK